MHARRSRSAIVLATKRKIAELRSCRWITMLWPVITTLTLQSRMVEIILVSKRHGQHHASSSSEKSAATAD
jgi:hypothetical protein